MKSDKRQTMIMIGISLLIIAGVFAAIALSQPKVYTETPVAETVSAEPKTAESSVTTTTLQVNYPLNVNTATLEELMTIDGLGEKRATAIIEYRSYLGKYTSEEQLMDIDGFGEDTYRKIAGYLTV